MALRLIQVQVQYTSTTSGIRYSYLYYNRLTSSPITLPSPVTAYKVPRSLRVRPKAADVVLANSVELAPPAIVVTSPPGVTRKTELLGFPAMYAVPSCIRAKSSGNESSSVITS